MRIRGNEFCSLSTRQAGSNGLDPAPNLFTQSIDYLCGGHHLDRHALSSARNLLQYVIDTLLRTYLMFVGTVMAHEGVHGHLGRTRAANFRWGRLALLPTMVPFTNFRKTHHLHHAYTNIPGQDPDHFMKSRNRIEIVLRAIAMPHQWFFWLWKRGRIRKQDLIELIVNYLRNRCGVWRHSGICGCVPAVLGNGSRAGPGFSSPLVSLRCSDP